MTGQKQDVRLDKTAACGPRKTLTRNEYAAGRGMRHRPRHGLRRIARSADAIVRNSNADH